MKSAAQPREGPLKEWAYHPSLLKSGQLPYLTRRTAEEKFYSAIPLSAARRQLEAS